MQIKDIKKETNNVSFFVELNDKEWKDYQNKSFKKLGKNVKIEGFRPGKVPVEMLKKMIDPARMLNDAVNSSIDFMMDFLFENEKFLEESDNFLDDVPDTTIEKVDFDSLVAKFSFYLWPKVDVKYKDFKFETKLNKVTDKDVENKINEMTKKDEMLVPKEGAAAMGDTVIINFKGFVDDKPFAGGEAKNYELKLGSKSFIDTFEDQLVGLKAGDKKDVNVTFPKEYHAKELAGKKAKFETEVNVVNVIEKPKLDDEYVSKLNIENVKTVSELKAHVKKELEEANKNNFKNAKSQELITQLLKESKIDPSIPDSLIKKIYSTRLNYFMSQFQAKTIEDFSKIIQSFGMNYGDFEAKQKAEILQAVQLSVLFIEISKIEKIEIEKDELDKAIDQYAKQLNVDAKEVEEEKLVMKKVREQILKEKAYKFLSEKYLEEKKK